MIFVIQISVIKVNKGNCENNNPKEINNNKIEIVIFKEILLLNLKNKRKKKIKKIKNLCKKDPAINSSPKGPPILLPSASNPNKSTPLKY